MEENGQLEMARGSLIISSAAKASSLLYNANIEALIHITAVYEELKREDAVTRKVCYLLFVPTSIHGLF
jgi:hypothetical protein